MNTVTIKKKTFERMCLLRPFPCLSSKWTQVWSTFLCNKLKAQNSYAYHNSENSTIISIQTTLKDIHSIFQCSVFTLYGPNKYLKTGHGGP
jgi:hypothetical protein